MNNRKFPHWEWKFNIRARREICRCNLRWNKLCFIPLTTWVRWSIHVSSTTHQIFLLMLHRHLPCRWAKLKLLSLFVRRAEADPARVSAGKLDRNILARETRCICKSSSSTANTRATQLHDYQLQCDPFSRECDEVSLNYWTLITMIKFNFWFYVSLKFLHSCSRDLIDFLRHENSPPTETLKNKSIALWIIELWFSFRSRHQQAIIAGVKLLLS